MHDAARPFLDAASAHPGAGDSPLDGVPAPFSPAQATLIRELRGLHERTPEGALLMLAAWTPGRFSPAQSECIGHLLALDARDFQATLADAMHPVPERGVRSDATAAQPPDAAGRSALHGVDSSLQPDPLA